MRSSGEGLLCSPALLDVEGAGGDETLPGEEMSSSKTRRLAHAAESGSTSLAGDGKNSVRYGESEGGGDCRARVRFPGKG